MPISDKLTLDITPFLSEIKKADAAGVALSKKLDVKSSVDFDIDKSALGEVDKIKKEIGKPVEVPVKADVDENSLSKVGGVLDSFKNSLGGGGGLLGSLGGSLAALANPAGLAAAAAGGLAVGLAAVYSAGSELLEAQLDLQAKTGETGEAFLRLKSEAREAFVGGVGESVAEATKIISTSQNLLGDILPTEQLGEFTAKANALGKLYDKDVTEVIQKSTPFIKQFGLSGDEAFNLMALAMKDAGTASDDVLDSLAEYSQLLKGAGFSAEEFVGTLTAGGEAGLFNTDKIVDSIKEAQIRLKAGDINKAISEVASVPETLRESINKNLKLAESDKISVKDFLQVSAQDIEKQFKEGKISESMRTQLQVAIAGTPAEDLGSEVYGKIFGAPIPKDDIEKRAREAGENLSKATGQYLTFDQIGRELSSAFQFISADVVSVFEKAFADVYDAIQPAVVVIGGIISGVLGAALISVTALFSQFSSIVATVFRGISQAVAPIFSKLADLFGSAGGEALTLSGVLDKFGEVLNFVAGVASEFGKLIGEILVTGFQILYGVIGGVVTIVTDIVGWFSKLSGETKETGKNAKESGGFFAKLGNIIADLQFYIAGAVAGFREIKTVIGEVGEAVFSLDFGKVFDLFSNFGGRVSESAKKGFDAAKKSSIEANKLAEETAKKNEEIRKKEEAAAAKATPEDAAKAAKKRFDAIKSELDTQKKINGRKLDALKLSIEQEAAEQGRKVTGEEQAKILQLENKLTDDLLKKSRELFKVTGEGEEIKVGVALGDNKEAAKDIVFGLQSEFDKSNLSLKKLGFVDEPAKFKERIEESIRGLSDLEIETKVRFGVSELDAVADYKSALNKLAQEEQEARERANDSTDKEQIKFFIDLAEKTKKARIDGEKKLTGELQKIQEQRRAAFISGIEDDAEREIETKIAGLEKQRDAELSNVFLTETQKAVIVQRFEKQINELRNKGAFDYLGTWQNVMTGISSAFAGQTEEQKKSFEEAKKTLDEVNAAGSERLQQIDDEIRLTLKQGKTGTLSYNQQAEKIKELEEKKQQAQEETAKSIEEANKKLEENTTSVLGRLRNSFVKSFDEISKTTTAKLNEVGANIGAALLKVGSDFANFEAVGAVVMENLGAAAGVAALSLGSAFGAALASGTLSLKSFAQLSLGIVFDTIQAAVNAYAAQIFAVNAAALPFGLGIPGALGLIATVNALLAAARAGIGAEDGVVGIDGNYSKKAGRTDTIPILVAPNESIITAKATAKHYKLLDAINNDRNILGAIRDSLTTNELKQLAATYYTPSERGELGLSNNSTGSGSHSYRNETFNINAKLVASGDDLTAIFNRRTKRKIRGW